MASQAEALKATGNELFKKGRLGAAIEAYTEAIALKPDVPVFWTNRATCYRKRNEWAKVESDCRRALELDRESVKAHYMLGLSLTHFQHFPEAVKELQKALDLILRGSKGSKAGRELLEAVSEALAKAKFEEWQAEATERKQRQESLRNLLQRLLKEDHDAFLSHVSEAEEEGSAEVLSREIEAAYSENLNTLENVFDRVQAPDRPEEVPEHLCCKITMDIFRDPVITPSGISYERAAIEDHLQRGRNFDPVTRQELKLEQLVPNLGLRDAVQAYLDEHGWAYKCLQHTMEL